MYSLSKQAALLALLLTAGVFYSFGQTDSLKKQVPSRPRFDTLASVIITPDHSFIHLRGDTLEYNTIGIQSGLNSSVEELLKRLQGVKVDAQGGITVNGKKIERLLIDGVDVFGGDPTLVTRSFNADMIAKIQVLDKKTRKTQFTGIDDGETTPTLNLVLKEDRKKGYFGNAGLGADPQGYYNGNVLLGSFVSKRQFTAIGKISSDGTNDFSGATDIPGSPSSLGAGALDPMGASAGTGIPRVKNGALHYANSWKADRQNLAANYEAGQLNTEPVSSLLTGQLLPDTVYLQNQQSRSWNTEFHQNLVLDYDDTPDSLTAFQLHAGAMTKTGNDRFASTADSYFNNTLVNAGLRNLQSDVRNKEFRANGMWRINSRKNAGRVFSVTAGFDKATNTTAGYLYAVNRFFRPDGSLSVSDTTDQRKQINGSTLTTTGSLNYTEPLWKNTSLALGYELSFKSNSSLLATYNKADEKYDTRIDSLSSDYQGRLLTQKATLSIQSAGGAFSYTLEGNLLDAVYKETDRVTDSLQRHRYLTFAPIVHARYRFKGVQSILFSYFGRTQLPSFSQLQPVQNNNDPLHITLGNPALQPASSHSFYLSWQSLGELTSLVTANYLFVTHLLTTRTYTDTLGRQISQPVNAGGSENAGLLLLFSKRIAPTGLDLGFHIQFSNDRSVNFVNTLLSRNNNFAWTTGFSLGQDHPGKYYFRLGAEAGFSDLTSSIHTGAATRYRTQNHTAELGIFAPWKLEANTSMHYSWREKISAFDKDNTVLYWNASLVKKVFRNRLVCRWQINDILDRNAAINRSVTANEVVESYSNIIGRYWMISVTWFFRSTGSSGTKESL